MARCACFRIIIAATSISPSAIPKYWAACFFRWLFCVPWKYSSSTARTSSRPRLFLNLPATFAAGEGWWSQVNFLDGLPDTPFWNPLCLLRLPSVKILCSSTLQNYYLFCETTQMVTSTRSKLFCVVHVKSPIGYFYCVGVIINCVKPKSA